MPETMTLDSEVRDAIIYGFPTEKGQPAAKRLYDEIYQIDPTFVGTYQEALALQMSQGAQVPESGGTGSGSLDEIAPLPGKPPAEPAPLDEVAPMGGEQNQGGPQTTLGGVISAAARGGGLDAVMAGIGQGVKAATGANPAVGVAMATPSIVDSAMWLYNQAAQALRDRGVNISDGATSKQLWNTILDSLGLQRADTPIEQRVEQGAEAMGDAATFVAGGNALAAGTRGPGGLPVLNPSTAARTGQVMAERPISQIVGAGGGVAAGAGARRGAEALGAGETVQDLAELGGNFLGDALAGWPGGAVDNRLAARNVPLLNTREASLAGDVQRVYGENKPLMTDEMTAAINQTQQEATRAARRASVRGGTGDMIRGRAADTTKVIQDVEEAFHVEILPLGDVNNRLRELGQRWVRARHDDFLDARNRKWDVLGRLSDEVGPVNTSNTQQVIADVQGDLTDLDAQEFSGLIGRLGNWAGNIQDASPAQIERELNVIQGYLDDPTLLSGASREQRSSVQKVVNSLRDDLQQGVKDLGSEADYNQFMIANRNLADLTDDFKNSSLKTLIDQYALDPDRTNYEAIGDLLRSSTTDDDFARLVGHLDDEGKELLQEAIVAQMIAASDPRDPSAVKFANQLQSMAPLLQKAFDSETVEYFETIQRAFDAVGIPAQRFANPNRTEQRLSVGTNPTAGPYVAQQTGRLGVGSLFLGALAQVGAGRMARNAQTPQARNLAARIRNVDRASDAELELSKRLLRVIMGVDEDETFPIGAESPPPPENRRMGGVEGDRPTTPTTPTGGSAEQRTPTTPTGGGARGPVPTTLRGRPEETQ